MRTIPSAVCTALVTAITAVGFTTASLHAQAASQDDIKALREQIRQLDQKLRVLERNTEIKEETAAAAAKKSPKLTVSDGRVEVASADGANSLRLRGLVQADTRFYLDNANAAQDGFLLRRARLIFEGKFADIYQYVVQPEFAGTVQILDAYVNGAFTSGFQVQAGRFKTPVGLEQLQSDAYAFFNERSIATNLAPNRDVGVQIHGDLLNQRLTYGLAAVNGVLEGGNSPTTNLNAEGDFTVAGRLFATPFVNDKDSALKGLGFGLGATHGNYEIGAPGTTYKTDGQQTFFAYRAATVTNGAATTISPQAYYYYGPLGVLAEYFTSSTELRNGANSEDVTNTAWNLSIGYVLTGEESSYFGVKPATTFNPSAGTWGAFEVVGRVAQVNIDDNAFTGGGTSIADPTTTASTVTSYGIGLNWYLSRSVRTNFDIFQSKFDFHSARPVAGALSDDELAIITRFQVSF